MKSRACYLVAVAVASVVSASAIASPVLTVQARQKSTGQIVKQVTTDTHGRFALGSMAPGDYNLEFRCYRPRDASDKEFTLIVNGVKVAGRETVAGSSLVGGVGLAVSVPRGARVTGQIASGTEGAQLKTLVWMPQMLGSNLPGRWVEKGSMDEMLSSNRTVVPLWRIREMQEHGRNDL
jgi:hypothetical protein